MGESVEQDKPILLATNYEQPHIALGMLLEEAWLPRQSTSLPLDEIFASLGAGKEKVWRVKALAPRLGAAASGDVMVGDVLLRIDGNSISGVRPNFPCLVAPPMLRVFNR